MSTKNPNDGVTPERREIFENLGRRLVEKTAQHLESGGKTPLFDNDDMRPLDGASLAERAIYERYSTMVTWLATNSVCAKGSAEIASRALAVIEEFVNDAISSEAFDSFLGRLPTVVVSKDFLEIKRNGVEAYLTEDGRDIPESIFDIFIRTLKWFIEKLGDVDYDDANNPLATIRDKYNATTVTSEYVLKNWHVANQHGFYELKTGKLSNIMTKPEYGEFVDRTTRDDLNAIITNHLQGGYSDFEQRMNEHPDSIQGIKWHDATDAVTELTKWDAIHALDKLYGDPSSDLKDMANEFPELVDALLSRIATDFKLNAVKDVPIEKWREPWVFRRMLYRLDFYDVKRTADTFYKTKYPTGIAVVQDVWEEPEKRFFDRPRPEISIDMKMRAYMPRFGGDRAPILEGEKQALVGACRFLNGYNHVVGLVMELFNANGFGRLRINVVPIKNRMVAIRCATKYLQQTLNDLPDIDKLRTEKLRAMKNHFLMPNVKFADISPIDKTMVRKMVANLDAFQRKDSARFSKMVFGIGTK